MLHRTSLSSANIFRYLKNIGQSEDHDISLSETALLIAAQDRKANSIDRYRDHLDCLVQDTQNLLRQIANHKEALDLDDILSTIETVLYDIHGYKGDIETYDDLENANLIAVIERRKGLPIVLGILYLHIIHSINLEQTLFAAGLNFPGHFLIRISYGKKHVIVDPFDRGKVRDTPWLRATLKGFMSDRAELQAEFTQSVSNRNILLRLQNNIKVRLIEAKEPEKALEILEKMLLIAPNEPVIWREAGMLQAFLNNILAAIETLEHYLQIEEDHRGLMEASQMLQKLKAQLN
ncbi:SirB1 family protein [Kiloniella sp. EL199]|uniref:SirB1 family protein n=1 Tax=Kiloniella sp. EL199 TaxID=2107581 RepID=UPI000EA1B1DF|nr:tetratricopeptide repeat protein [Kiloniella sp. EL199]